MGLSEVSQVSLLDANLSTLLSVDPTSRSLSQVTLRHLYLSALKGLSQSLYILCLKERHCKYLYFASVSCNCNYHVREIPPSMFTVYIYRLGKKVLE